jgi:thymidine phosphorylase
MDAPLGRAVGNALEVIECIEVLKGKGPADLIELSIDLAARMLVLGRVAANQADAKTRLHDAVASGAGVERFRQIIEMQGGDPNVIDDYSRFPTAPNRRTVTADRDGYLNSLDALLIGRASVSLGAGRDRVEDPVDPAVGIMLAAKPGDAVRAGQPLLELHYRDRPRLETALALTARAIHIADTRPDQKPLIVAEVR